MKKLLVFMLLCGLQCACASSGGSAGSRPDNALLSYDELSAEITVTRTPVDEPLALASDYDKGFWAAR